MDGVSFVAVVTVFLLYFLPGMYASHRKHRNREAIWATNILLGWTVLGWIVAAIWASTNNRDDSAVAK